MFATDLFGVATPTRQEDSLHTWKQKSFRTRALDEQYGSSNHVDFVREAVDGTLKEHPVRLLPAESSQEHPVISVADLSLPGTLEGLLTVKSHRSWDLENLCCAVKWGYAAAVGCNTSTRIHVYCMHQKPSFLLSSRLQKADFYL